MLLLAWVSVAIAGYYAVSKIASAWHHMPDDAADKQASSPRETAVPPTAGNAHGHDQPGHPKSELTPLPAPRARLIQRVDWHDKQNWRHFLKRGMSRSQVRQLFGDPERDDVVSTTEFWDYGDGRIEFNMDGHPDGILDSWFEPER